MLCTCRSYPSLNANLHRHRRHYVAPEVNNWSTLNPQSQVFSCLVQFHWTLYVVEEKPHPKHMIWLVLLHHLCLVTKGHPIVGLQLQLACHTFMPALSLALPSLWFWSSAVEALLVSTSMANYIKCDIHKPKAMCVQCKADSGRRGFVL